MLMKPFLASLFSVSMNVLMLKTWIAATMFFASLSMNLSIWV